MDYSKFFSADVPSFLRSPVREIFRKVDLNAICSFAGGYPAACTFPMADIPAGIAMLLAAMSAKGTSTIDNIEQIDRGYEDIEGRLNALGAHITRA